VFILFAFHKHKETQTKIRAHPEYFLVHVLANGSTNCWQKTQTKIGAHQQYFLVHVLPDGSTNAGRNLPPPKKISRYTRGIFWFMSWPTVQPMLAESTPLLAKQIACSPAGVLHRRRQRDTITTTTSTLTLTIIAAKTTPLPTIQAASHRSKLKPLTVKRKQFKSPT